MEVKTINPMIPPKEITKSEKMLMQNIGYLVKISNVSRNAWSKKIGISRQTVSAWFDGRAFPQTSHLKIISNKHKVSIDFLVRKDLSNYETEYITANYMFIQKLMKL